MGGALLAAGTALALASTSPASAGYWTGHTNLSLGLKHLESAWDPVDDQVEYGVEVAWGRQGWPVLLATDLHRSVDERKEGGGGSDITGSTLELDLGVRKVWTQATSLTFIGGGLAAVRGKLDRGADGDHQSTLGPWVGGGMLWRMGTMLGWGSSLGFSLRYTRAETRLSGQTLEAGGLSGGLLWGFAW